MSKKRVRWADEEGKTKTSLQFQENKCLSTMKGIEELIAYIEQDIVRAKKTSQETVWLFFEKNVVRKERTTLKEEVTEKFKVKEVVWLKFNLLKIVV